MVPASGARPRPVAGPHFGITRHGLHVHLRTTDHLQPKPGDSRYQRANKRIALWLTQNTGTMTCFWVIEAFCLLAVPSVLFSMNIIHLKILLTGYGFYLALTWGISTNFQAVMLPALAVGQNIQNESGDARAAKQFEDAEETKADVKEIKAALVILNGKLDQLTVRG